MFILQLFELHPLLFFVLLLLGLVVCFKLGVGIGQHRRKLIGEGLGEGATLVVGGVLGLLAFVLALNLSNATSR